MGLNTSVLNLLTVEGVASMLNIDIYWYANILNIDEGAYLCWYSKMRGIKKVACIDIYWYTDMLSKCAT